MNFQIQAAGKLIAGKEMLISTSSGSAIRFTVNMREGGLEILPNNPAALIYIQQNRAAVIGKAVIEVVKNLDISADRIKTIFLELK